MFSSFDVSPVSNVQTKPATPDEPPLARVEVTPADSHEINERRAQSENPEALRRARAL